MLPKPLAESSVSHPLPESHAAESEKGAGILFTGRPTPLPFFRSLFRLYRTGGADILAGAAIDARLGIYHVNARIAQRDRSHGAGIGRKRRKLRIRP